MPAPMQREVDMDNRDDEIEQPDESKPGSLPLDDFEELAYQKLKSGEFPVYEMDDDGKMVLVRPEDI
ncbi:MAG: hypothetical protein IAI50_19880 [Candidatus Eremiobacteraeota bacterium]|nr:hypothetical protein [Candidatus Eremiobacteraeota bacterium]